MRLLADPARFLQRRGGIDWISAIAILVALCSLLAVLTFAFVPSLALGATGASSAPPAKAEDKPQPADPLARTTPYGTVIGFLRAVDRNEYDLAARFLEGKQPLKQKKDLARALKIVLNRGLKIGLDDLSKAPEGRLDDDLNVYLEKVGTATYGDESLDIVLRRMTRPDMPAIWLFSTETLGGVQAAADQLEVGLGESIWPDWFREITFLSFPLFLWINQLVLLPLLWIASWLVTRLVIRLTQLVLRRRGELAEALVARLKWPLCVLIFATIMRAFAVDAVTVAGRIMYSTASSVLIILATTWALVGVTRLAARAKIMHLKARGVPSSIAAVELSGWVLVCFYVVSGLFLMLRNLGFEVTAAVAGLGVGGIAIAFAAQKTLENLFGTVTIVTDKPIHVGDSCHVGTTEGTVESIGLRSSRIRTADRTLVTIPNGQLAAMTIGNSSDRDKFLFRHNLRLQYDTTADQVREILSAVAALMTNHAHIEAPSARARLTRFGEYALELEVFAYVRTRDSTVFAEAQQDLLLGIMDIVEAAGAAIAVPLQPAAAYGKVDASGRALGPLLRPKERA